MDISGPRVTPSRPDYWSGTPLSGSEFTKEQWAAHSRAARMVPYLESRNLPLVYRHTIMLERGGHEYHTCPVLGCTRDRTRLKVIAPNGMETYIPWKK